MDALDLALICLVIINMAVVSAVVIKLFLSEHPAILAAQAKARLYWKKVRITFKMLRIDAEEFAVTVKRKVKKASKRWK